MAAAQNSYLINVYPEIADVDTSFVENGEVNIEQLLSLEPDVVFYAAGNTDERAMYDNAGIPAVGFSTSMAEYDCVETVSYTHLDVYKRQPMSSGLPIIC